MERNDEFAGAYKSLLMGLPSIYFMTESNFFIHGVCNSDLISVSWDTFLGLTRSKRSVLDRFFDLSHSTIAVRLNLFHKS